MKKLNLSKYLSIEEFKNVGFYARNLTTNETVSVNENKIFGTASVIKIALVITILKKVQQGELDFFKRILIDRSKVFNNGVRDFGILKLYSTGSTVTLETLCLLTLSLSDNAATNLLLEFVDVSDANKLMKEVGLINTKFTAASLDSINSLGQTTAKEFLLLLEKLVNNEILNKYWSKRMIEMMSANPSLSKIGYLLPTKQNYQDIGAEIEWIANKTGVLPIFELNADVAILDLVNGAKMIICIFTQGIKDKNECIRQTSFEHRSTQLIIKLGKDLFELIK